MTLSTWTTRALSGIFATLLFALASTAMASETTAAQPTPEQRTEITALVKQLRSPSFDERNSAAEALIEMANAAKPVLQEMLDDENAKLTMEQRQQLEMIVTRGVTGLLEVRSHLDEASLDIIRQVRAGQVDKDRKWDVSRQLEAIARQEDATDEALALVIDAITPHLPTDGKWDEMVLQDHTVGQIFSAIADRANIGEHASAAIGRWVAEWYVPYRLLRESDQNDYRARQFDELIRKCLIRDLFDAATFATFTDVYCRQLIQHDGATSHDDIRSDWRVLSGIAFSRHTTSEHMGELIHALLAQHVLMKNESGFNTPLNNLNEVAGSPHMTDAQARVVIDTMLAHTHTSARGYRDLHSLMCALTGHQLYETEDYGDETMNELVRRRNTDETLQRWRQWWADHPDKPLLKLREDKSYRFVSFEIDCTSEPASVTITADTVIPVGRESHILRHPDKPKELTCIRILPTTSRMPYETHFMLKEYLAKTVNVQLKTMSYGSYSGGERPILPGVVQISGTSGGKQGTTRITGQLLIDTAEEQGPTTEQLSDVAYVARKLVEGSVDLYRMQRQVPMTDALRYTLRQHDSLASFAERYPVALFKDAISEWASDPDDGLTALIQLSLAKWDLDIDSDRLIKVLESDDSDAMAASAEALALKGYVEPVDVLISRLAKDAQQDDAYRTLLTLAGSNGYDIDVREALAARIIERLLPKRDDEQNAAFGMVLLVQQWSKQDFGYRLGGKVETNNAALAEYHAWAKDPVIDEPAAEPTEEETPASNKEQEARLRLQSK